MNWNNKWSVNYILVMVWGYMVAAKLQFQSADVRASMLRPSILPWQKTAVEAATINKDINYRGQRGSSCGQSKREEKGKGWLNSSWKCSWCSHQNLDQNEDIFRVKSEQWQTVLAKA